MKKITIFSVACLFLFMGLPLRADDPGTMFLEADQLLEAGELDEAAELYQAVIDSEPDDTLRYDAKESLGEINFEKGRLGEARQYFTTVSENHPDQLARGFALFSKIEIALLEDDLREAEELIRRFESNHPDHPIYSVVQEEFSELIDPTPEPEPEPDPEVPEPPDDPPEEEPPTEEIPPDPEQALAEDPELRRQLIAELERLKRREMRLEEQYEASRQKVEDLERQLEEIPRPEILRDEIAARVEERLDELRRRNRELLERLESTSAQNRELAERLTEYQSRLAELEDENELLTRQNQRLTEAISQEIVSLVREGRLTDIAREVELTDTAVAALDEREESLRARARQAISESKYDVALNNLHPLLQEDPTAVDHYLAAQAYWRLSGEPIPALEHVSRSIEMAEDPDPERLLLKAEILLEADQRAELEQFLARWGNWLNEHAEDENESRWFLIRGRRLLNMGADDRAFFELMRSVNAAPGSAWAQQARTIINEEL